MALFWTQLASLLGPPGQAGPPGPQGAGVPAGGSAGQILRKASNLDYDTDWEDVAATDGAKGTDLSYDAATRLLSSSTGAGATLPLVGADPGLLSPSDKDKLDGAIQPNDTRLSDAREWSAETISRADAEAGTATTRRAFTAQRVFQAIAAWWAASTAKTKLDGIAAGATANATDAQLRERSTHTGTQPASTITGLATVATTGSYTHLSDKPTYATNRLLGRSAVGAGAAEEITPGSCISLNSGTLNVFPVAAYQVGNWIAPYDGGTTTGSTLAANTILFVPFFVWRSITVNELAARVTTAASGSFQLAIYGSSATTNSPAGAPLASTGGLIGSVATIVSQAVTSFPLIAGRLYYAAVNRSSASLAFQANGFTGAPRLIGAPTLAGLSPSAGSIESLVPQLSQPYGTWPDVTSGAFSFSNTQVTGAMIFMKVSSIP